MIAAVIALAGLAAVLGVALAVRSGFRLRRPRAGTRRILVPFTGGTLDPTVLDAAIRLAQAESATLVPAYLLLVPLRLAEDSPLRDEVAVALPLLEAVEHAGLRAGVPVDARIEKGRSPTHALRRLWEVESFDRIVTPAPTGNNGGFTAKDVSWILANSPTETVVLKPAPRESPRQRPRKLTGAHRWRRGRALPSAADAPPAHDAGSERQSEARGPSPAGVG
jgi:universal stress protein family protein